MYKKILVPLDASSTAQAAAEHAIALARECRAALRFIHVIDFSALVGVLPSIVQVTHGEARLLLDDWIGRATQWGLDASSVIAETGPEQPRVADAIVGAAADWGADLIAIGSHGRGGVRHLMLGSVAEAVARASSVPVLIVHP